MGVFWAWGVGGGWIGVSAYCVGAAHRRIGVFWAWRGVREEIGVSAYRRILDLRGRWVEGGGDRRNGVSAYVGFLPLSACTLCLDALLPSTGTSSMLEVGFFGYLKDP